MYDVVSVIQAINNAHNTPRPDADPMSTHQVGYLELIDRHIAETYHTSKETTYGQYRTVLVKLARDLEKLGYDFNPDSFDRDRIIFIRDTVWNGQAVSTMKWKMHILDRYLRFYGNDCVKNTGLVWSQDMRPHATWIEEREWRILLHANKTPLEEIVVNLELCCGLRSVEVIRLRVQDVHIDTAKPYFDVRGKGRGNGKYRTVPFGYQTERALQRWFTERDRIIKTMRAKDPTWIPPDNLLLWLRYTGRNVACNAYSERGHSIDRSVIAPLRETLGFDFSHHTLRRTFGRTAYYGGMPLATLSKILGHDDVVTTLKYIGTDMDNMMDGMDIMKKYMDERL